MSFDPKTMTARELEIADTAFREGQGYPTCPSPYARPTPSKLATRYTRMLDDEMGGEGRNAHAVALDRLLAPVRAVLERMLGYAPNGSTLYEDAENTLALLAPGGDGA